MHEYNSMYVKIQYDEAINIWTLKSFPYCVLVTHTRIHNPYFFICINDCYYNSSFNIRVYKIAIIDDLTSLFNYHEEFKIIYLHVYNYKDNAFHL